MGTVARLQNVRGFTVQIRHISAPNKIVGTGIVVDEDKIVTCAHVVRDAGVVLRDGTPRRNRWTLFRESVYQRRKRVAIPKADIPVYFHQEFSEKARQRRAVLESFSDAYKDDVVVLQLLDGPSPLTSDQFAKLGCVGQLNGHRFETYGYPVREHDKYKGKYAGGTIQGRTEAPRMKLRGEPIELRSAQILGGMSGAAVLDTDENLVVGIISERTEPRPGSPDPERGYAVDVAVLGFAPFNLLLERTSPAHTQVDAAWIRAHVSCPEPPHRFFGGTPEVERFTGRTSLLQALDADWADSQCRVVSLIGLGGEGKSSLALKWVSDLSRRSYDRQPVFWWTFTRPDVDEFFAQALRYMTGGALDLTRYPSTAAKAELICEFLAVNRYLFVIDGLEILQREDDDQYGVLRNPDFKDFLHRVCLTEHESLCLITSRLPVDDLREVPESHQNRRDVARLSTVEGQELLRNIGVSGSDLELNEVVEEWHGHALSLNLIGGYLVNCFDGDVSRVEEIAKPTAGNSVYERVQRILGYYNTNLPLPERTCLVLFSAFRAPVGLNALAYICHSDGPAETLTAPLKEFSYSSLEEVVARLVDYRIIQTVLTDSSSFLHPLVREYYHELLAKKHPDELRVLHQVIKEFYLSIWESADRSPTIISLRPRIEAVYHACLGGLFDEGCQLYRDSLEHGGEMILSWKLNAYDTVLALMQEFFAEPSNMLRGISEEANSNNWIAPLPRVSKPKDQRYILNRTGVAMMNTGRLKAASAYYKRAIDVALQAQDKLGAIHSYQNLSEVSFYQGDIKGSARAAEKALQLSRHISNREEERDSLVYQGWAAHLRGELKLARAAFYEAEELQRQLHPERPFLADLWGIVHADYLLRTRDFDRARIITEANLQYCEAEGLIDNISICHRVLGDLDANEGRHHDAGRHYDKAVEVAHSVYERTVMLEVLLARGRWAARYGQARMAEADLDEALGYARSGGYRLYLVDTLIGRAWLGLRLGGTSLARSDAESAKDQSAELKYYWGELDSTEVLNTIG